MTLIEFLEARLDEDEAVARAASQGSWDDQYGEFRSRGGENFAHILRHNPARVLREVEAKRRIVEEHAPFGEGRRGWANPDGTPVLWCKTCTQDNDTFADETRHPCRTIRLLVLPYADHEDYRPQWAI